MTNFRPISTDGFLKPAGHDLGAKPVLEWIPITDLVVDETYQRRISREGTRAVKRIAASFDWMFFSPVIVAPIEGKKWAIIDGQHRTTAAALVGIHSVPCQIVLADPRQQAAAFAAINGQIQRITSMQVYHAAKEAGDAWAVHIAAVAAAAGVTILRYPLRSTHQDRPRHSTMSVRAIEKMINRYGVAITEASLNCITKTSLGDDPAVLGVTWMLAIASALFERQSWLKDVERHRRFFDEIDAGEALSSSVQWAKQNQTSQTEALAIELRRRFDDTEQRSAA